MRPCNYPKASRWYCAAARIGAEPTLEHFRRRTRIHGSSTSGSCGVTRPGAHGTSWITGVGLSKWPLGFPPQVWRGAQGLAESDSSDWRLACPVSDVISHYEPPAPLARVTTQSSSTLEPGSRVSGPVAPALALRRAGGVAQSRYRLQ